MPALHRWLCGRPASLRRQQGGVPECDAANNSDIDGYQVCHKWLKDRKGRTLSDEDIAHYQKIVVALNETICLMVKINRVIETHGGWPDAFHVPGHGKSQNVK